jgi:hypothetical protein
MEKRRKIFPLFFSLTLSSSLHRAFLKQRIIREVGVNCYDPANGQSVTMTTIHPIPVNVSTKLLQLQQQKTDTKKRSIVSEEEASKSKRERERSFLFCVFLSERFSFSDGLSDTAQQRKKQTIAPADRLAIEGVLLFQPNEPAVREGCNWEHSVGVGRVLENTKRRIEEARGRERESERERETETEWQRDREENKQRQRKS